MEGCPNEILHIVCSHLSPKDAASMRLVNRAFAAIAGQYLVTRARFHASPDSVKRLVELSEHPVFGQKISTLFWEAARLNSTITLAQVKNIIRSIQAIEEKPKQPAATASPRELRLYNRNLSKWNVKRSSVPETFAQRQFELYEKALGDERIAQGLVISHEKSSLFQAIQHLPHLKKIFYDNNPKCRHLMSDRFVDRYRAWDIPPPLNGDSGSSIDEVKILLAAVAKAGIKLEELTITSLAPMFFFLRPKVPAILETLSLALSHLKSLTINFKLNLDHEHVDDGGCWSVLERGGIREMAAAAPQLRSLDLSFDTPLDEAGADMTDILGDHTWSELKSVSIQSAKATVDFLLQCLLRQPSLSELSLGFFTLTAGSWSEVARRMQRELKLQAANFHGLLTSLDPDNDEFWDTDATKLPVALTPSVDEEYDDHMDGVEIPLAAELRHYILWGSEDDPDPFYDFEWISNMS